MLSTFTCEQSELTLSEVAAHAHLARATARRILLTLERLGYVAREGRTFSLRARALDVGYAYLSSLPVAEIAVPYLVEISRHVNESCSVAVLDGRDIVHVARAPVGRIVSIGPPIGTRLPAHRTAMGQIMLAALAPADLDAHFADCRLEAPGQLSAATEQLLRKAVARVRVNGFALMDQELEVGIRSVAVPLLGSGGVANAALSVSAQSGRMSLDQFREDVLPLILDTAALISQDLGYRSARS